MKFEISRTSIWDEETSPYEGAAQELTPRWQTRTCTEEEFNQKFAPNEGLWRSKGTEHKITSEGHITRRMTDKLTWVLELTSLEELMELYNRVGELIIMSSWNANDMPRLEIYDDYRE